jgi:outer membrane protein TolC
MRTLAIILFHAAAVALAAQDTITLFECHRQAFDHSPRLADRAYIEQIGNLKASQTNTAWYPSLDLNGKASYQSDVVTVELTDPSIPVSFPEVPNDQYGLNLDIRQTLYDGGISRKKKEYEQAMVAADLQQMEVDLYGLKTRVNQYFFTILILQENHRNLGIHLESLQSRRESLITAVEQGILTEAELKVMDVEILKVRQSIVEVESRKNSLINALNVLCGTAFPEEGYLELPAFEGIEEGQASRPEYRLFDLQLASMEAGKELIAKQRMPVLYAFGQTGYGKPGYNMLSGKWDFYYMVGAGLRWNIWDWNSSSRERQVIENQQQMLHNRRATFDQELESMAVQEVARIEQYKKTMELDNRVLELQREISRQSFAMLSNGTITATDYITELNKENLAQISLDTHRVLLKQSIANFLTIQGNL